MGAPDLPPDVLRKLLDQLLDDKRTLSSCALVCRVWLQIARPLLFHSINVRIGLANRAGFVDQLAVFVDQLAVFVDQLAVFVDQLAVFDAFLQETPQLGVLVKRLALANAYEDLYKGRGRPAVKLSVLAPVLAKLPNLVHLSFHSVSLVFAPQLPPLSLRLDRLELFHVPVARNPLSMYGAPILDLLSLFSSINTLSLIPSISPPWIVQPVFISLKSIPIKVRVRTLSVLDIVKRGYDLALALLINALDFSCITRFTARINSVDDLLPVGGVLRRMDGLRELELSLFTEESVSQAQWSILCLSTLTSLRSLTLNVTLTPTSVTSGFRAFRSIVPLILSLSVPLPTTPDSRPDSTASTPRPLEPAAGTLASATTSLSNHAHTSNASNARNLLACHLLPRTRTL
ncbi:unnamed protein product [Somion occarium]|uniref:F-box domain-containing protein n=1 Tax=Somion occarium TaxID=3059160 RepID=A0ABP1E6K8_9APHY